jgi:hypothetical protein
MFYRRESAMADRNPIEEKLAQKIHAAEYSVAQANAAPAGANRIERIQKAYDALDSAEQSYDDCLSCRAYQLRRGQ